jgi:hypothetical protein
LTTHFRLRISGVIPLLPLYAFMAFTATTLPYSVLLLNVYFTLIDLALMSVWPLTYAYRHIV